jgi:vitamin B12 transporter
MTFLKNSVAALALLPVGAFAQEANEDIVVTASGFEQPRSETGQAISIIDENRLADLQATSITDALRTLPGVTAVTRGSVGSQSAVFLRGGNGSQTLVLVDGVRINDPSSPNAAFDFGVAHRQYRPGRGAARAEFDHLGQSGDWRGD